MTMRVEESTYTRLGNAVLADEAQGTHKLSALLIKAASDQGFNDDQVRRLVERTNTMKQLALFSGRGKHATAADVAFEPADPEEVLQGVRAARGDAAPSTSGAKTAAANHLVDMHARQLADHTSFVVPQEREKSASGGAEIDPRTLWAGTRADLEAAAALYAAEAEQAAHREKIAAVHTARAFLGTQMRNLEEEAYLLQAQSVKLAHELRLLASTNEEELQDVLHRLQDPGHKIAMLAELSGVSLPGVELDRAHVAWDTPPLAERLQDFFEKRAAVLKRQDELEEVKATLATLR